MVSYAFPPPPGPAMKPERIREALGLFRRCMAVEPHARLEFLERTAVGDAELRDEVAAMLRWDRESEEVDPSSGQSSVRPRLESILAEALEPGAVPERIGSYRILRLIGTGGMGLVYEAEQDSPRRRVALKVLRPGSLNEERRQRFDREVEILGRLRHPGIAQVHEGGTVELDGQPCPFLSMELVQGVDLLRYCDEAGLDLEQRLGLLADISEAVQHAHQRGVIHRDLKPENILITPEGRPKILDFGVALVSEGGDPRRTRLTRSGELVGTLAFMSPEQLGADPDAVTFSADVYSLGVVAFEVLTDRLPISVTGSSLAEALRRIQTEEPLALGQAQPRLGDDAEAIVAHALEKDPARRYRNAGELADDLRRYLRHEPIHARRPTLFYQLRKLARRHSLLFLSGAAVFAALALALVLVNRSRAGQVAAAELANRQLHRTALRAASYAVSLFDVRAARSHLDSIPPAERDWAWNHVNRQVEPWIFRYELPAPPVGPPAYLDGGKRVAFAHRQSGISLCDADDGRLLQRLASPLELQTLARSCPTGQVVAGARNGRAVVWDLASGEARIVETTGTSYVRVLDAAADGTVATSADGRVVLIPPGGEPRTIEGLNAGVWGPDLTLGPRGRVLAVLERLPGGTSYQAQLGLWDLSRSERLWSFRWDGVPHSLAFSADGALLAVGNRQRDVVLLNAHTGDVLADLYGHAGEVSSVAFSPDGALVVSTSGDGTARLWSVAEARQLRVLRHGWSRGHVAVDPRGRGFTVCSQDGGAVAAELIRSEATVLRGHPSYVYSVDVAPQGDLIASAGFRDFDRSVRLWDPNGGPALAVLEDATSDSWAHFTDDGRALVLRPAEAGEPLTRPLVPGESPSQPVPAAGPGPEGPIREAPPDRWLAHLRDRVGRGRPLATAAAAFAPDDRLVATRTDSEMIVVRRGIGGERVRRLAGRELIGHPSLSPDDRFLACPSGDRGVYVWDLEHGSRRRLTGHADRVFAVAFSPDGRLLASGGNDTRILLWDATAWDIVLELLGHDSYVYTLAWSPDGTRLVSGGGDRSVRVWDSAPRERRHRERLAADRQRQRVLDRLGTQGSGPAAGDSSDWTEADRRAALLLGLEGER